MTSAMPVQRFGNLEVTMIFKILCRIGAWLGFIGITIYLPIMSYRGIEVPLDTKAILVGVSGLYLLLWGRE